MSAVNSALVTSVVSRLGDHADRWDELVDGLELPSPFLRSWWVDHAAAAEPAIVLVTDGGRLLGGLALQRRDFHGVDRLGVLGGGPLAPDHLDIVATDADRAAVTDAVVAWLRRPGSRIIDLDGMAVHSSLVTALAGSQPDRFVSLIEPAPYVRLPATSAEYLASRPGKSRSTISRTDKRLTKAGVTFRVRPAVEVDQALDTLQSLHDGRWAEESGFLSHWDAFAAAARAGAARGEVVFSELVAPDGQVIATEVDFVVDGHVSFYQAGRLTDHDWRGSGSMLKARIIGAAIDDGAVEFDLLRGAEPYKTEWAEGQRPLVLVQVAIGPRAKALLAGSQAWARLAPWLVAKRAELKARSGVAQSDVARSERVSE